MHAGKILGEEPTILIDGGPIPMASLLQHVRQELAAETITHVRLQEHMWTLDRISTELAQKVQIMGSAWSKDAGRLEHSQRVLETVIARNAEVASSFDKDWDERFASLQAQLADYQNALRSIARSELLSSMSLANHELEFPSHEKAAEWVSVSDRKFQSIADELANKYRIKIGSLARIAANQVLEKVQAQVKAGQEELKKQISEELTFDIPVFDASTAFSGELLPAPIKESPQPMEKSVKGTGWLDRSLNSLNDKWGYEVVRYSQNKYVLNLDAMRRSREAELYQHLSEVAAEAEAFVDVAIRAAFAGLHDRVSQRLESLRVDLGRAQTTGAAQTRQTLEMIESARVVVEDLDMQQKDLEALRAPLDTAVAREMNRA